MTKTEREATQSDLREKILELVKKYNDIEIEKDLESPGPYNIRYGFTEMVAYNPNKVRCDDPGWETELRGKSENWRYPETTNTECPDHGEFWQASTQSC